MKAAKALRYAPTMPKKGRPSTEGILVSVRLPSSLIADIDEEVARLTRERPDETVTRATAIKVLLRAGVSARKAGTK